MKVLIYQSKFEKDWNNFLINSKNSTFLFNRNFVEYHADRFKDHSLIVLDESGKLLALMPANITSQNILISHQGLTYGGLIVDKDDKLPNILQYFSRILAYLSESGINTIVYKEIPSFYNQVPADEIQYILFLLKAQLYRRDTSITIQYGSRLSFQKRRTRSIKAAEKAGVEVREEETFESFWNSILLPNLLKRFGVKPVHSLEEITLLRSYFPNNIRQFNAYLDGKIMAGTTIFETPTVAHAQYISASEEGRRNGSLDFLFHHLIENTFSNKSFFDFGICNEQEGLKLNEGLLDWKEGFGGRCYSHNFYEIKTSNYTYLDNVFI